jgi:copper chaperone CopZ
MKTFFFLFVIALSVSLHAQQITKVSLQASGLTCSMCSNSINKALKTVGSVDKVNANIQNSSFEITFKDNNHVDFEELKKKVEDAGFSVSRFIAFINFSNVPIKNNQPVVVGDKTFVFVNVKDNALNGETPVQVIDKGFISAKQYKKNPLPRLTARSYHAII